jgi:hypothetical protein
MELVVRPVLERDWPEIRALAERSVAHVPAAGSQEDWHRNRRSAGDRGAVQRQVVVEDPELGALLGYGAVESDAQGELRLFVVTTPDRLADVGELLYRRGLAVLGELGARRAWFTEYAADEPLLRFARARGFSERRRFELPGGTEAVTLCKELGAGDASGESRLQEEV